MGYREEFFKHTKARAGRYQCVRCKKWFHKCDIDVDHRIPKRNGGTDDLWNLQDMCKHCNRSKKDNQTTGETINTLVRAAGSGELGKAVSGIVSRKGKDLLGIKYKR